MVPRNHIVSETLVYFGTKYEAVWRFDLSITDLGHNYLNVLSRSVVDRSKRRTVSCFVQKQLIYLLSIYWNCSIWKHELVIISIREIDLSANIKSANIILYDIGKNLHSLALVEQMRIVDQHCYMQCRASKESVHMLCNMKHKQDNATRRMTHLQKATCGTNAFT